VRKIIVIASLFSTSGCAVRSVYVPSSENVLLFANKKQLNTTAFVGTNHAELHISQNPVNHLAVGLNATYGRGLSIYEGCMGFYNYSKNSKWRYEVLGGGGHTNNFSEQDNAWFGIFKQNPSDYQTIANYNRYYIQPSFGFFSKIEMYKLTYSFSITSRLSYLYFNKYIYREIDANKSVLPNPIVYIVNKEYYNKNLYLLEPCITNKVGLGNVFAIIQGQFMIPYSNQIDVSNTKFSNVFILSLGLQYNFLFKKQKGASE